MNEQKNIFLIQTRHVYLWCQLHIYIRNIGNCTRSLGANVVVVTVVDAVVAAVVVIMMGIGIGTASPGPLFTGTVIANGGFNVFTGGRMMKILPLGGNRFRVVLVPVCGSVGLAGQESNAQA